MLIPILTSLLSLLLILFVVGVLAGYLDYTKFTHMDVSRVRIACPNCGMELRWQYQRLSFDDVRFTFETPCEHCRYSKLTQREIEFEVECATKAIRIQWFKKEAPTNRHVPLDSDIQRK